MYLLKTPQKTIKIAGVEIGGHPGQYPLAIIAELFMQGDPLVKNEETGEIDKQSTQALIHRTIDTSRRTGLQLIIAVIGHTATALSRYIEYVAGIDDYKGPIVIDGPNHEIRIPAVKHAVETGLRERVIYDSVHPESPDIEFEKLAEYGISSAVLMASNTNNVWPEGRLDVLLDNPETGKPGLLSRAKEAGINKIFIDSAVLGGVGGILSAASVRLIKEKTGWPVGAGTGNIIEFFAAKQDRTPIDRRKGILAEGEIGWRTLTKGKHNWLHHVLDVTFDLSAVYAGVDYLFRIMH
ncbi:MAG: hypothetical protein ACTSVM_04675, partial [Candidatus Ranarchaeia archaeon]